MWTQWKQQGGLGDGQAKAHEVEVEPSDHLYACPLHASPITGSRPKG